jgi:hypothetical protein
MFATPDTGIWRETCQRPGQLRNLGTTRTSVIEGCAIFAALNSCVIFLPASGLREDSMDKRITFRFYKVVSDRRSQTAFGDALTQIANIPRRRDREAHLGTDLYARAEIITPERGAIVGEMTRIQRTNFPSEVNDNQ